MYKLFAVALTAGILLGVQAETTTDWIKKEKIKATYTWMSKWHHKNPEKVASDLHNAGFNSVFLKGDRDPIQRKRWIDAAQKYDLKLFICFNYWSKGIDIDNPKRKFRHAVYKTGKTCAAPCPLNYDYWKQEVLRIPLEMTELSLKHKCIAGLLLDTEMYGINPHAFLEDVCFCEKCFDGFLKKQKKTENIEASQRYSWLKKHKLLKAYYAYLETEFAKVAAKFRKDLHKKNPDLLLGNLNFVNTWFFRGLLKGFGTKKLPAISAPESPTYRQGYIPFVNKQQRDFKRQNFHIYYVPGIWDLCFYPDALAENCYKLAVNSDGYFDFTIRALYSLIPQFTPILMKKSGGDMNKYWQAFKYANSEISKKVKEKSYQSPLNRKAKNIANKILYVSPTPCRGNLKALIGKGQAVTWNIDNKSQKVTIIIQLEEQTKVKRVKVLCQGGGNTSGLYYPAKLEVYYTKYNGATANAAKKAEWSLASTANEPDNQFAFKENGHHSAGAYLRWMTTRMPIRSIETRFVKLVFFKQSDKYAEKVTGIGQKKVKQIKIMKIEVI
jgi:hypothetical protein